MPIETDGVLYHAENPTSVALHKDILVCVNETLRWDRTAVLVVDMCAAAVASVPNADIPFMVKICKEAQKKAKVYFSNISAGGERGALLPAFDEVKNESQQFRREGSGSAFSGGDGGKNLKKALDDKAVRYVLVMGWEANQCVHGTVFGNLNLGTGQRQHGLLVTSEWTTPKSVITCRRLLLSGGDGQLRSPDWGVMHTQ